MFIVQSSSSSSLIIAIPCIAKHWMHSALLPCFVTCLMLIVECNFLVEHLCAGHLCVTVQNYTPQMLVHWLK